ncbi:hypothetical protein EV424DRAFT_96761 [Suillus variegatus]|nr:hypothetical protein EV424DRAFT_96761 [Suillus variegatus]
MRTTGSDTAGEDDAPPSFPAIKSAQRAATSLSSSSDSSRGFNTPNILTNSGLIPPPPVPGLATRRPGVPPPQNRIKWLERLYLVLSIGEISRHLARLTHKQVNASMRIPPSVLKSHNKKEDA